MSEVKSYDIPGIGNFSITHCPEDESVTENLFIEAGFYGSRGVMTVTDKCSDLESAKIALNEAVLKEIAKNRDYLAEQNKLLDEREKDFAKKGLDAYLTE